MKVLVLDVGGTHVKALATGYRAPRKIDSGASMTPRRMVREIKKLVADWSFEAISMGYPGLVLNGRIASEPHNLGEGWVGFDFERAFGLPVVTLNDAAMQALGAYRRGRMLFLGLGTGLGSAMITDGLLEPMELAHLPYKKGLTYEDYVGKKGLARLGKRRWRKHVADVIRRLRAALEPNDVVIGGGNAKKLKILPPGTRLGTNADALAGGFRIWSSKAKTRPGRAVQVPGRFGPRPRTRDGRG
jgi:polyphosphate glucokinase